MENETNKQQDCGCNGGDCCTPKKSKLWMKIVFVAIVLAAIAIITVKLVNKGCTTEPAKKSCCSDSTKSCNHKKDTVKINGSDTTKPKCCDKKKGSSCCSKPNE